VLARPALHDIRERARAELNETLERVLASPPPTEAQMMVPATASGR
jgi:hypothetical protein